MEVLSAVVVIEHLTSLKKQNLDVFPDPLGPITDDAQTHLLCRNQAGFFDLLEDLAELRLILHLMPTEHMDDALTIKQIEAKPFGVTPLAPPPRPLGPRMPASLLGLARAVGTGRHIGAIDAQPQDRTPKATNGYRGNAVQDLLSRGCHIHHGQLRAHLVGHSVHPFTPTG